MTELLSQFYDDAFRSRWSGALHPRAKVGPRWTRTMIVDPATLAPVRSGERGILRHFDLANCASISAVQTLDVGIESGIGFDVLGRLAEADDRGCSQLMSGLTGRISGPASTGSAGAAISEGSEGSAGSGAKAAGGRTNTDSATDDES